MLQLCSLITQNGINENSTVFITSIASGFSIKFSLDGSRRRHPEMRSNEIGNILHSVFF